MTANSDHRHALPTGDSKVPVPTFGCIVYVSKLKDGSTHARVANLGGLTATASTERDALSQLVPKFKQFVQAKLESGEAIEWIEPPVSLAAGEQRRFLPVHL